MRLYLVQHAEALTAEEDSERALSPQGREEAQAMAQFLGRIGVTGVAIWHSGKLRAQQTAMELATELDAAGAEVFNHLAPKSDIARLAAEVGSREADLLVVSHQPYLGRLASYLLAGRPKDGAVGFQPGTAMCLQRVRDHWQLLWMVPPDAVVSMTADATV